MWFARTSRNSQILRELLWTSAIWIESPLDGWSARLRELCLTKHNSHKRQTSMHSAGFEPAIPASERSQFDALDSGATGIGSVGNLRRQIKDKHPVTGSLPNLNLFAGSGPIFRTPLPMRGSRSTIFGPQSLRASSVFCLSGSRDTTRWDRESCLEANWVRASRSNEIN